VISTYQHGPLLLQLAANEAKRIRGVEDLEGEVI